jgi:cobalt/nickel transport system permease protein
MTDKEREEMTVERLMELIYRFLFVTLDIARNMIRAQVMRLGYRNLKTGMHSLGQGLAVLLSRTLTRSNTIYSALECRLYDGTLASLPVRVPYIVHSNSVVGICLSPLFFLFGFFDTG